MLTRLQIENFKCFPKLELKFKGLTILAGGNACGKSSVIQVLQYLSSIKKSNKKWTFSTELNGIDYGPAIHVLAEKGDSEKIKIELDFNDREYKLTCVSNANNKYGFLIQGENIAEFKRDFCIYYINAERIGPKTLHNLSDNTDWYVGSRGENAISLLNYLTLLSNEKNKDYKIDNLTDILRAGDDKPVFGFDKLCNKWLNFIIDSTQLLANTEENVPYHHVAIKNEAEAYVPAATGFGISYCLPIIIQGLAAAIRRKAILIVENPEAHLHPKGQSRMGKFLALLAISGVQIIIETHSEHIINGARLILGNQKHCSLMNIIFFSHSKDVFSQQEIEMNDKGELSSWPEGFFDQNDSDIMELLKRKFPHD